MSASDSLARQGVPTEARQHPPHRHEEVTFFSSASVPGEGSERLGGGTEGRSCAPSRATAAEHLSSRSRAATTLPPPPHGQPGTLSRCIAAPSTCVEACERQSTLAELATEDRGKRRHSTPRGARKPHRRPGPVSSGRRAPLPVRGSTLTSPSECTWLSSPSRPLPSAGPRSTSRLSTAHARASAAEHPPAFHHPCFRTWTKTPMVTSSCSAYPRCDPLQARACGPSGYESLTRTRRRRVRLSGRRGLRALGEPGRRRTYTIFNKWPIFFFFTSR